MLSLLNISIGDYAKAIIDMLIKVIYLLYASLAAGVDAMQSILRKLVGLDQYWQISTSSGNIVKTNDPLTEFIYGILGYGESSASYKALNTVFWSLAIFGLIVLIITTMVAIVKSHYNEDSQQTDPWKYIYTAGKSIFTFILLPIVTILGLQITSFILKTLDNITGGTGSADEIEGIYGKKAVGQFKGTETSSGGKITYIYYDYFGTSDPSTTTTFSGTLFNACMYNANRLRIGSGKGDKIVDINVISSSMGGKIFGQGDALNGYTSDGEKKERVAYQIDYAFVNNLQLASSVTYSTVKSDFEDVVLIVGGLDLSSNSVKSFSKFNVALIWCFYDLWQFNFIVGFAGVFTTFAIMISIVIGLIGRLFKGAALFLIYPAILGIAPLDNFKAFKSWGTNFIQQVMMAFGSIIGVNILLLILPYIQTLQFFEYAILNYMMNVVMLVTGLVMAKDFSSIVSGFVGGDDAIAKGDNMKGQVAGAIKSGITAPTRVVGGVARLGLSAATAPIRAGRKIKGFTDKLAVKTSAYRANKAQDKAKKQSEKIEKANNIIKNVNSGALNRADLKGKDKRIYKRYEKEQKAYQKLEDKFNNPSKLSTRKIVSKSRIEELQNGAKPSNSKEKNAVKQGINVYQDSLRQGLTEDQAKQKQIDKMDSILNKRWHKEESYLKSQFMESKRSEKQTKFEIKADKIASKNGLIKTESGEFNFKDGKSPKLFEGGFLGQVGKRISEGIDGMGLGRALADSFVKTIEGIGSGLGLDKSIKTLTDELGKSLTFKGGPFKPSLAGDTLQKKQHAELMKQDKEQIDALRKIKEEIAGMRNEQKDKSKKS